MSDVQFDEQTDIVARPRAVAAVPKGGGMGAMLVRRGYAKSEQSARVVLVSIAVCCLIAAAAFFFLIGKDPGSRYGNFDELKARYPERFTQ